MGRLQRLLYLDVTLRTSGFAWLYGFATALATYGVVDWHTVVAAVAGIVGIIAVQGYEHALDVLHDRGGYSAFRSSDLVAVAQRYFRPFTILMVVLAILVTVSLRPWLFLAAVMAVAMARLYVLSHNEWYATAGFMLAYMTGYFSATNTPSLAFLLGFIATGFIYKASLSMYRLDDYLDGELPGKEAIIQYYRNIFRYTLHYVPVLVALQIAAIIRHVPEPALPWWAPLSWVAGFAAIAVPAARYRAHLVSQEALIHYPVIGIMLPELYAAATVSAKLLALYLAGYSALLLILLAFWTSRHALCNVTGCPLNPLLNIKRPK